MRTTCRPVALLCLLVALTSGCGGSSDPAAARGRSSSAPVATGADTAAPTAATDLCPLLTADAVGTVVGYPVTFKSGPYNACEYSSEDARSRPNISIATSVPAQGNGGFAGTKAGALAVVPGTPRDLAGIGTEAFVVSNKNGNQFALGYAAAMVKGQLVTVNLTGGALADLDALTEKLLRLAASKV